ncbi:hypothetical protein FK85_23110 [Halorubrum saccharovorum]|uniref:Uncharacterized protein n=1 Tax=Halorubrum saccharovorum TaxID=2248 RepID=A0A0F8AYX0_9EURY|nr:hypothetical protein FK85_23110 [Halorubrum saccharovorum]
MGICQEWIQRDESFFQKKYESALILHRVQKLRSAKKTEKRLLSLRTAPTKFSNEWNRSLTKHLQTEKRQHHLFKEPIQALTSTKMPFSVGQ